MAVFTTISTWFIPLLICFILLYASLRKVATYEVFVEGAKEGVSIAFSLIPFLVGMIVAITIFRASGALELVTNLFGSILQFIGVPGEIIPLALIRPISGTAALGVTSDLIATHGPDSYIGRLASIMQGSTDTTLYILTVYFGAVSIKRMGDALKVGLLADFVGIIAALIVTVVLFT